MPNDNVLKDIECPECGSTGPFDIHGASVSLLRVTDDGTEDYDGASWSDSSRIECCQCRHSGTVRGFTKCDTMKLRVYMAALTRMECVKVIEVPSNTPESDFDRIARVIYDETDVKDFSEDLEYWERGNCYCEHADPNEDCDIVKINS